MIKILIVDDHDLVRTGLRSILDAVERYQVIGEADSAEAAIDFVRTADSVPDVVLMDINMPGIGGIEGTRRLLHQNDQIKVIAVTAMVENPFPSQLSEAGAQGYVTKGCPAQEMFAAIDSVVAGKPFVSSEISEKLTTEKLTRNHQDSPFESLSSREMQVMMMIIQGASNQFISDSLFLSPKTISTYRHRLYDKLGVKNDVELTHMAIRHGISDV